MTDLAGYLEQVGLAGRVATSVKSCVENCRSLVAGHPDYTFGLSDWRTATYEDAVGALAACGVSGLDGAEDTGHDPSATAWVDPGVAAAAVARQAEVMGELARSRARVLIATGHAFALLTHYAGLARALSAAGGTILEPLAGERERFRTPEGRLASFRYYEGVGSLVVHGSLTHTHRPDYMQQLIAAAGGPSAVDAVIGDHGYAGAAVEAGITTLSIADVNDPALPLAQARGRTNGVLVIDDGLGPEVYEPITAALVAGCRP